MIRIVSNFKLPPRWTAAGESGTSVFACEAGAFLRARGSDTVWVVNCDPGLTFRLGTYRRLWKRLPPLIAVDLVLRRPEGGLNRAAALARRGALGGVSHFIHYFRDVRGLKEVFGIGPERSSFVPFKANLAHKGAMAPDGGGEYVLCFGRSLRDFDTFFSAVEQLPYPAAIAEPDIVQLRVHGARFTRTRDQLPRQVRLLADDGSEDAQVRILKGARIVVLPIVKRSIVASGISTCLNAMLLGKCVIGSEGPGMSDIFAEEVVAVPPEDPGALAAAIRRLWEDDALRLRTAATGHAYALRQGGEAELFTRIIETVVRWRGSSYHA